MLKIDMVKDYDRVERMLLEEVMLKMGFSPRWVQWITICASTMHYSIINVKGKFAGFMRPLRGIRQGDPLCPYFFIIVVDVLSQMIHISS